MAYSTYQEWLFEKVCYLRDVEKLTFDAIAKRITSEGFKSANRSNSAVVIFGSPNTADHSEKLKFVVMITLVRSYKRLSK